MSDTQVSDNDSQVQEPAMSFAEAVNQALEDLDEGASLDEVHEAAESLMWPAPAPEPYAKPKAHNVQKLTPEERDEQLAAVARLSEFDPDNKQRLAQMLNDDDLDEDQRAEIEFRLDLTNGPRAEFAATFDKDLRTQVESLRDEASLLDAEIEWAKSQNKGPREMKALGDSYVAAVEKREQIQKELELRQIDSEIDKGLREQSVKEAERDLVRLKQDALREALGERSLADHLQKKEPPRRKSPATIQALEFELTQPLDPKEVELRADEIYQARKAEIKKAEVTAWRGEKAKQQAPFDLPEGIEYVPPQDNILIDPFSRR